QTVTVRAGWSGSVAGISAVAGSATVAFLSSSTPGDTNLASSVPDFAMADNLQANTAVTSPILEDSIVGVVPFVWARGVGTPTTLVNMTFQQAKALMPLRQLPLSVFPG